MKGTRKMKTEIEKLIAAYREEKSLLEHGISETNTQLVELRQKRSKKANEIVSFLLPDLEAFNIKMLRLQVPSFKVPTVPIWFWLGLRRKIDPGVSLELLRVQLGHHLDTLGYNAPVVWYQDLALKYDTPIDNLQQNIAETTKQISKIDARINSLEQLLTNKPQQQNPKVRQAIEAELRKGVRYSLDTSQNQSEVAKSDIFGDDLLTTWLWYSLLMPDTTSTAQPSFEPTFEPGGGKFGGGGAEGSWENNPETPFSQTDPNPDNLSLHADLGSNNFS
jgi:hypothetical protein